MRIAALGFEIGFGARHKEAARFVKVMKPLEVDISSVHDVEGPGLGQQQVENVDVVQFAVADVHEGMLPRRSKSVCSLIAALVERKGAQEKTDRHRSMVLASRA